MRNYDDRVRGSRAVRVWRLFRRGELPAHVEVVAVQGTPRDKLGEARQAVRDMANENGSPLDWLGPGIVTAATDDADEMASRARADALDHGLTVDELPSGLRN